MRIVYLHGRMSGPNAEKCKKLREMGHEVFAPELVSHDWTQSVTAARQILSETLPDVVIGSSRGGAVAMATNTTVPLVLIAPAWAKYCPWGACRATTTILHCKTDRIVSYSDSEVLSRTFGADLVEIGNDHRMNDDETMEKLIEVLKKHTS